MEGKPILPASVLSVKIKINEDIIRISFPITITFKQLKAKVFGKCGLDTKTNHCLKYEDEEGDMVTLASEADFLEALHVVASTDLLKLTVTKPNHRNRHSDSTAAPEPSSIEVHSPGDVISKEERQRIKQEKKALCKEMKQAKKTTTEDPATDAPETTPLKGIEKERKCKEKRNRHLNTITEPSAASTPEESAAAPEPTTNEVQSSGDVVSKEERNRLKKELKHARKALREEMKSAKHEKKEEHGIRKERKPKRGNTIAEPSATSSVPIESAITAPEPTTTVISKEEHKRIKKELKHAKKALRKEMKHSKQPATEEAAEPTRAFTTKPETVAKAEKRIEKELRRKQKREERAQLKETKRAVKSQIKQQNKAAESDPSSSSSEDEMADLQQQMEQLGFTDKVKNERVLKRHQGNLESALVFLRGKLQQKADRDAKKAAKEAFRKSKEAEKLKNKDAKTAQ